MAKDASVVSEEPQEMIVIKKKTNTSRSWIVFDAAGQGTLLDMDKYAIMQRVQINARDLRILDPFLSYPSTIMGRERAIVLNLEHIKAIITAEEVLLQDPTNENVVPVVEELQRILLPKLSVVHQQQGDDTESDEEEEEDESPFEFRVIEVALEAICSFLAARTTELEIAAYPTLEELTSKVSSRNLDKIRKLKSSMTRLTARVQQVKDEVEQLLGDDDDMADLYLSRKAGSTSPVSGLGMISTVSIATSHFDDENDVEELEMLLEAYFVQIDSTLNKLTTMREYINDTEDYINFQLDNHRNKLIKLELGLNAATVCVSVYSLIAGIFGMNIPYSWNDNHGYVFKWVVLVGSAISTIMFIMIIGYCRKRGLLGS